MAERLPTYEKCAGSDDPRVRHQWAFVQWPFLNDQGYTPAPDALELWSVRLDQLGYVHGPTLAQLADENGMIHVSQLPEQTIKLAVPYRGQQHYLNGAAMWIDRDADEVEPVNIPDPAEFTVHEQLVMQERMRYTGTLKDPEPEPDGLAEEFKPQFNPTDHTPSAVNGYLEACSAMGNMHEMKRVVAAEMMGKHRQQILKRWPGV